MRSAAGMDASRILSASMPTMSKLLADIDPSTLLSASMPTMSELLADLGTLRFIEDATKAKRPESTHADHGPGEAELAHASTPGQELEPSVELSASIVVALVVLLALLYEQRSAARAVVVACQILFLVLHCLLAYQVQLQQQHRVLATGLTDLLAIAGLLSCLPNAPQIDDDDEDCET